MENRFCLEKLWNLDDLNFFMGKPCDLKKKHENIKKIFLNG